MKCKFMWRLIHSDGISVTDVMTKNQMLEAHKQNPDWIPQRVKVIA